MRCAAFRCRDDALPDGQLCEAHQRRLDRGGGLPVFGEPVPGDPSGHGQYGLHDVDELGVACHECGARVASLGLHIRRSHDMSAGEYQRTHGLKPINAPPRADGRPRRRPHPCRRCRIPVTTTGKLCDTCTTERRREQAATQARRAQGSRPRWRELTEDEATQLRAATDDELDQLVPELQLDRVPMWQIVDVLGGLLWQARRRWPRPRRP